MISPEILQVDVYVFAGKTTNGMMFFFTGKNIRIIQDFFVIINVHFIVHTLKISQHVYEN